MANVYPKEYLEQFEVKEQGWRDDLYPDAKRLRDKTARQLRKEGWTVKVETYDYTDLGRFRVYALTATRPRRR